MNIKQRRRALWVFAAVALVLSGCSSNPIPKNYESLFATRISESGLKHFELRYRRAAPSEVDQRASKQRDSRRSNSRAARNYEQELKKMQKHAEQLIEENGYCRDGFWVLDFDIDTRGRFLRGECNEVANAQDRANFPDMLKNW